MKVIVKEDACRAHSGRSLSNETTRKKKEVEGV
jgi:hypothetical protein